MGSLADQQWVVTGHDEIDRQHTVLFGLVGRAREQIRASTRDGGAGYTGNKAQLRQLIGDFAKYAIEHFAYEEKLMEESSYPGVTSHRSGHRAIELGISQAVEALDAGQDPLRLVEGLVDAWIRHHISRMDGDLARHLQNSGQPALPL